MWTNTELSRKRKEYEGIWAFQGVVAVAAAVAVVVVCVSCCIRASTLMSRKSLSTKF